ncbi:MAG TPA: hypothetical protein VIL49_00350 [Capillimicrobium sp.]
MQINRATIATGGTLAALGVLTAIALSAGSVDAPSDAATDVAAPAPEVRTETVRRTVRVRRPSEAAGTAVASPAVVSAAAAPAVVAASAPAAAPRAAAPAPAPTAPAPAAPVDDHGGDDDAFDAAEDRADDLADAREDALDDARDAAEDAADDRADALEDAAEDREDDD